MLTLTDTGFAAAWAGMLVFDLLVFCMTLYKSIVLPHPNGANIPDILMRDGELLAHTLYLLDLINIYKARSTSGGPRFSFFRTSFWIDVQCNRGVQFG